MQDSTKKFKKSHKDSKPKQSQNYTKKHSENLEKIKILNSHFLMSISNISQAPSILYTEIAILGRSNVGKSTLINSLLNNKNLAKSSSTPGKTQLINFFLSNWQMPQNKENLQDSAKFLAQAIDSTQDSQENTQNSQDSQNAQENPQKPQDSTINNFTLRFIDFPGFGYAKVSKSLKSEWDRNLSEFVKKRDSIKLFIHLVDSRHTNLEIDENIRAFLGGILKGDCKILEVLTKSDKLTRSEISRHRQSGKILVSNKDKVSIEILRCKILESLYGV